MRSISCLSVILLSADAFAPNSKIRTTAITSKTQRQALWRHWIPEIDAWDPEMNSESESETRVETEQVEEQGSMMKTALASSLLAAVLAIAPTAGVAVSGGGLDFANLDISGQDYANKNYKGKDFTQVIAKGTNFAKSNLQGCRFYKAYLVNADFTDADIRGVSMEGTSMDGASLKNAVAVGTYFGDSILDVGSIENADFTDAQFPVKALPQLCEREDMKGTNPVTGADTRESAMCL